jgi:hypothetical protein
MPAARLMNPASAMLAVPPPKSVNVAELEIALATPAAIAALPAFTVKSPVPKVADAPLAVSEPPLTVLSPV